MQRSVLPHGIKLLRFDKSLLAHSLTPPTVALASPLSDSGSRSSVYAAQAATVPSAHSVAASGEMAAPTAGPTKIATLQGAREIGGSSRVDGWVGR